jgi:hypothetical protein
VVRQQCCWGITGVGTEQQVVPLLPVFVGPFVPEFLQGMLSCLVVDRKEPHLVGACTLVLMEEASIVALLLPAGEVQSAGIEVRLHGGLGLWYQ